MTEPTEYNLAEYLDWVLANIDDLPSPIKEACGSVVNHATARLEGAEVMDDEARMVTVSLVTGQWIAYHHAERRIAELEKVLSTLLGTVLASAAPANDGGPFPVITPTGPRSST